MAKKFNIGRQSEHLLNKEMHDLFMRLKYLSYNYTPYKDEQAPIPDKSLWVDRYFGSDLIKVFDKVNEDWIPAFKGYYHPANALEKPISPSNGQIWIDYTNGNLLKYYDKNTDSWIPVTAISNINAESGSCHDFDLMKLDRPILTDDTRKIFAVHNEKMGKLFDGRKYIHPSSEAYTPNSLVAIEYIDQDIEGKEVWVHVNSKRLDKVVKRLIKVNYDEGDSESYKINISSHNTEFYGMDLETGLGTLLVPCDAASALEDSIEDHTHVDFHRTDVGIELLHDKYEYIYAISYNFSNYVNTSGKIIRNSGVIGTEDNVHIGATNKRVFVFLDGLYLEQDKYEYSEDTDSIRLINDNIEQLMDMVAITVPNYAKIEGTDTPLEFTINHTGPNEEIAPGVFVGENDAIVGALRNAAEFKHPMAFVCGVHALPPREVEIIDQYAIIRNIGPMEEDDFYKVMIIEADGMNPTYGTVGESLRIESEIIESIDETRNTKYFVFIDGVLVSPRDLDVANGSIGIMGLVQGQEYLLLKANEEQDVQAELMFDSAISHFTTKIEDDNANTIYDNIDAALVYIGDGALIDRDGISVDFLPVEGHNGQIVMLESPEESISSKNTTVQLYKYDTNIKSWEEIPNQVAPGETNEEFVKAYDLIHGFFATKGSISILNKKHVGSPYTYFVYSYANSIDERLLWGDRVTTVNERDYAVNHRHRFIKGQGSLTAYINGLYTIAEEEPENKDDMFRLNEWDKLDTIGTEDGIDYSDQLDMQIDPMDNSSLTYIVEKLEGSEDTAMKKEVLTAANRLEGSKIANTYETGLSLTQGVVNVYVNGVRLTKDDFAIVSSNVITILTDTVGGQIITEKNDPSTYNKYMVMGEEGPVIIDCEQTDEIIIEVRNDYTIKEITLPVRYERQRTFSVKTDGVPESLINSNDEVKIFVNGYFYGMANKDNTNKAMATIDLDRKEITLNHEDYVNYIHTDPIYTHFKMNPEEHDQYIMEHGNPYNAQIQENYITFEWR